MQAASCVPPWCPAPESFQLGDDEVHVWRAVLNQDKSQIEKFFQTLATDEQVRAGRFYFERDRDRFIVARGVLRAILGRTLDRKPECLSFCYNAYGKPALAQATGGDAIRFNLSHSHGVALYAVSRGRAVGIDVEYIRCDLAVAGIAERFFSPREVAMLRSLPAKQQHQAFFRCWTSKEAYVKARGEGLSLPLEQFDVSMAPGEPAALLATQRDPSEASRWSLRELTAGPGYAATLAVEGRAWHLTGWQWPDLTQPSV